MTETNLQIVHIPCEALSCKGVECTNVTHRNDISKFYNDIVQVLCEGGDVVSNNTYCRNGTSGVSRGVFWLPGNPPGHDFFSGMISFRFCICLLGQC